MSNYLKYLINSYSQRCYNERYAIMNEGEATDCSHKLLIPLLFSLHSLSMICYSEQRIQEQQKLSGL